MQRRIPTEQLLTSVLKSAPIILFAVDRQGIITLFEGRGTAVLSLEPGDLVGRSILEVFADYPTILENVRRALAGESFSRDVEMQNSTWWEVYYAPLFDERDEPNGFVGVATDLTDRKRAEEESQRQLRFLDSVVDNIPDTVFVKDAATLRFVRLNRAGEELIGRSRDEVIGKTSDELFGREKVEVHRRRDREVIRSGKPIEVSLERVSVGDRGARALHIKELPIFDENGRPRYLLGICEDITERTRVEHERQHLVDRLRELDLLKARLIANVSHEFRTPLTLIVAVVERLLQERSLDGEERGDLDAIRRHALVLRKLVNDLLDIARLEAGAMRLDYTDVDVAALARSAISSFEVLAHQRNTTLSVCIPDTLLGQVDAEKVQRILANLLANALKFTPRGGTVRCSLTADADRLALIVEDTGPGIPPELRAHVFDRFFRIEGRAPGEVGSGLGLTIVRELAQLHGGSVRVEESAEGGARFVVELPLRAPAVATVRAAANDSRAEELPVAREESRSIAEPTTPEIANGERALVLVVEDNAELRRELATALGREYRVITASDGEEGLARALEHRPDLIVTDVMMPRMSGDELVRAVRVRRELDQTPVVVLTARADDDLRLQLLREGAHDYVMKPFSVEELEARIHNLVTVKRAKDVLLAELAKDRGNIVQLAEQLACRARELATALDAARVAGEQAERASRLKSDFLALVAHEVRTPVTSLRLQLQALERSARSDGQAARDASVRQIRRIAASAEQLFAMVETLLERAALESGRLRVEPRTFDLRALVRDVADEMRPHAEAKGLVLETETKDGDLSMDSDPRLVRLIVANLLSNAIKFTSRGRVMLSLSSSRLGSRIVVTDTGPGIPEAERTRIFEPFEQLAYLRQKHTPGLGLGLALVRDLARALGGNVEVDSAVGVGTTFSVSLPRRSARQRTAA